MINNKKLFVHIPKNGGMTIRHTTSVLFDKIIVPKLHLLVAGYQDPFVDKMKAMKRANIPAEHARWRDVSVSLRMAHDAFAIVRNPWDRVVSRYMFKAHQTPGYLEEVSFEQFIEERHNYVGEAGDYTWHLAIKGWFPAADYVTDKKGNLKCDMMRFGHMHEDVAKYFSMPVGTKFYIRNVSNGKKNDDRSKVVNRKPYQEFYTDKTIQIIADHYQRDIDLWGFDFDTEAQKNYWNV